LDSFVTTCILSTSPSFIPSGFLSTSPSLPSLFFSRCQSLFSWRSPILLLTLSNFYPWRLRFTYSTCRSISSLFLVFFLLPVLLLVPVYATPSSIFTHLSRPIQYLCLPIAPVPSSVRFPICYFPPVGRAIPRPHFYAYLTPSATARPPPSPLGISPLPCVQVSPVKLTVKNPTWSTLVEKQDKFTKLS
jgi:hypothetical protein